MTLPENLEGFLLKDTDPSIRYFTLRDLLDRDGNDPTLRVAHEAIGREGWAAKLLERQREEGYWESFHGQGGDLYLPKYLATNWTLLILADLGMTRKDPRIERAGELLLEAWSKEDGCLGSPGSEVCVTGNSVKMMYRFGFGSDARIAPALEWLVTAQKKDGGWHCFPSEAGTLDGWEAMAAFAAIPPEERSPSVRRAIERGAEFYLSRGLLTESDGTSYAPWHRLHYPLHYYYDLLVGLEMLSGLGYGKDPRMAPALDELEAQRNLDGTWNIAIPHPDLETNDPYHPGTPVYPVLLEHAGLPSRIITLRALRVLRRCGRL
jgi:hypothetical protein